jgi:hypothetical protein
MAGRVLSELAGQRGRLIPVTDDPHEPTPHEPTPAENFSSGVTRASSPMRELSSAQPLPADVTVTAAALGGVSVATSQAIFMNGGPGN